MFFRLISRADAVLLWEKNIISWLISIANTIKRIGANRVRDMASHMRTVVPNILSHLFSFLFCANDSSRAWKSGSFWGHVIRSIHTSEKISIDFATCIIQYYVGRIPSKIPPKHLKRTALTLMLPRRKILAYIYSLIMFWCLESD